MAASQLDKFVALGSGCYCSAHGSYLLHSWSSLDEANGPIAERLQCVCHDTLDFIQVSGFPSAIRALALTHSRRIIVER